MKILCELHYPVRDAHHSYQSSFTWINSMRHIHSFNGKQDKKVLLGVHDRKNDVYSTCNDASWVAALWLKISRIRAVRSQTRTSPPKAFSRLRSWLRVNMKRNQHMSLDYYENKNYAIHSAYVETREACIHPTDSIWLSYFIQSIYDDFNIRH